MLSHMQRSQCYVNTCGVVPVHKQDVSPSDWLRQTRKVNVLMKAYFLWGGGGGTWLFADLFVYVFRGAVLGVWTTVWLYPYLISLTLYPLPLPVPFTHILYPYPLLWPLLCLHPLLLNRQVWTHICLMPTGIKYVGREFAEGGIYFWGWCTYVRVGWNTYVGEGLWICKVGINIVWFTKHQDGT